MDVTAGFADADPAQRGLVWLLTSVDGVAAAPIGPVLYEGQDVIELSADLLGGRQLCASVAFDGVAGRAWETEEVCGDEFVCPADDDEGGDAAEGCGCASGGHAGAMGLLVGALALRRRRS